MTKWIRYAIPCLLGLVFVTGIPGSCKRKTDIEQAIEGAKTAARLPLSQEMLEKRAFFEDTNDLSIQAANESLKRGIAFFTQVETEEPMARPARYAWAYSARTPEGKIMPSEISYVSAGAGPIMGRDFLMAFETAGNEAYLDLASQVGDVLIQNQLKHGGWTRTLRLSRTARDQKGYYLTSAVVARNSPGCFQRKTPQPAVPPSGKLKEGGTQKIVEFLIDLGELSRDVKYKNAALRGLEFMLDAQHETGGWPNVYPPQVKDGYFEYELVVNQISFDDLCTESAIHTMIKAYEVYHDERYMKSALRGGEFILRTQNRHFGGWPQQVNPLTGEPSWGRGRFTTVPHGASDRYITPETKDGARATGMEPPALYPVRSASVIRAAIDLYLITGDERFFDSAKRGRAFLRRFAGAGDSLWYHFVDVDNGRPFFVIREGGRSTGGTLILDPELLEDVRNRTLHQATPDRDNGTFALNWRFYPTLDNPYSIELCMQTVDALERIGRESFLNEHQTPEPSLVNRRLAYLRPLVERVISSQGDDGAWLDDGSNLNMEGRLGCSESSMTIGAYFDYPGDGDLPGCGTPTSHVFDRNVRILCEYLALKRLASQYSADVDRTAKVDAGAGGRPGTGDLTF